MPDQHAVLSCSASHRWICCPGSVKLSEHYPSESSIYAEEGTLAHSMAEKILTGKKLTAADKKKVNKFYEDHTDLAGSFDEMKTYVEKYTDYVKEVFAGYEKADAGSILLAEQRVDLGDYIPGGFGTSDAVIVRDGALHIVDLKYGKGVKVEAEDNPQLKLYALGSLLALDVMYDIKTVWMTIVQPRLDSISTSAISAADLKQFAVEVVKPAAELALADNAPFSAGDWCKFCPAKKDCKARADHYMAFNPYTIRGVLSDDDLAFILGEVDGLVSWAEDVKEGALKRILDGEDIPGWKAVEGRSLRKYSGSEEEIVKAAQLAGYDRAMLYESKMLGVSAMEKMMGKKAFAEALGRLVEKPQGKPTLAKENDKRPSYRAASAAADFDGEM